MTVTSPTHIISRMYESLLFDMSYDLHERYAHLLTSALHRLEINGGHKEDVKVILNHLIEEMRNRSKEIYPLSYHEYGLAVAFKSYLNQVEKRYGVNIEFPTYYKLNEVMPHKSVLVFRLLQTTLKLILEYSETDAVEIEVDQNGILFKYKSYIETFPLEQKDLLELLQKDLGIEMEFVRRKDRIEWRWFEAQLVKGEKR
ncbi:hypothetical protein [Halobacillus sp. BBL2006]|uniref:hypothetical protein n=1 Tax=Halobacillus sp. BBL2006 TaxID=1543706 RepID=UPI000542837C|nr:hypothetical protein [Halobacillus sp. BBL2006]KHE69014.1 hypothetical protein LD39_13570 [Halobacillus sp. BBL2006]